MNHLFVLPTPEDAIAAMLSFSPPGLVSYSSIGDNAARNIVYMNDGSSYTFMSASAPEKLYGLSIHSAYIDPRVDKSTIAHIITAGLAAAAMKDKRKAELANKEVKTGYKAAIGKFFRPRHVVPFKRKEVSPK